MKCPKCSYVGFEEADRCRHCGYDFSLVDQIPPAEAVTLPLHVVEPPRHAAYREPLRRAAEAAPLVDLPLSASIEAAPTAMPTVPPSLLAEPQPPPARTPLAVRRTAERPRSRSTPHVTRRPRPVLFDSTAEVAARSADTSVEDAPPVAAPPLVRVASGLLDVALLVGIDAVVIYLTTQMAGVPVSDVLVLPIVPLAAFVIGLNVAYLAVFTANGGQTLGKMATGLRVEATDGVLTFWRAVVRVVAAIAGGLAMGAGFVPALWRDDRRAVHDHIAHTRVVKVSA